MKSKTVVMFRSVSWAQYWQVLIILLIMYYVYVLFVYYRKDMYALLKGRGLAPLQPLTIDQIHENTLEVMQSFCNEVTAYLRQTKRRTPPVPEIIFAIQRILQKFKLDKNIYEYAVNGFVLSECEAVCQLQLSEEDIMQVWADT